MASRGDRNRTGWPSISTCAAVRPVEPGQDAHQRRLAGAVLPDQGVHLAPGAVEIDVVVGDHLPEALADVAHGDRGCDEGDRVIRVMG